MSFIKDLCIAFLLTLSLMGLFIFVTNSPLFELKALRVEGNQKVSYADILNLCPFKLGQNLLKIDTEKTREKIVSDPRIAYVRVERRLPQKVVIRLEEKQPVLLINLENMYGLTPQGEIIPLEGDFNLPVVNGIETKKTKPYQKLKSRKVGLALSLRNSLYRIDPNILNLISEMSLKEKENVIFYLVPKGAKVLLGWGDFERKLIRFSLILRGETEFEKIECIDLRFKGQAIVRRAE